MLLGSGGGLVFGWAGLGGFFFALEFDFGILGTAGGFCFFASAFWLGWAAAGLGWALLTHVLGKIRNE